MKLDTDLPGIKRVIYLGVIWVFAVVAFSYPFLFPIKKYNVVSELPYATEQAMPDFTRFGNVVEKKQAFFAYLLPIVHEQNRRIIDTRNDVKTLKQTLERDGSILPSDRSKIDKLTHQYRVNIEAPLPQQLDQLLIHIDVIPAALVLMQGANESAWGTSRFATQGYNFFGLWCFKRGCGFVPKQRDDGAVHEVAKFKNLTHAVGYYFRNLNRHPAYSQLRKIRAQLRNNNRPITAEALAQGLGSYSERGQDYIDELIQMIRFNRKYIQ